MNESNQSHPNDKGKGDDGKSLSDLCVQRRKEVRRKKSLTSTARLLFDALTDDAFLAKYSVGFGVVRIGKPHLADELGCSIPTITRLQSELTPGELWSRTGWYEGHEITIWFLRGIASNQLEFDQFTDGVTKSPRTKVSPRTHKLRNKHGHFCKKLKARNGHGHPCKTADTPDLAQKGQAPAGMNGHYGHGCRGATVMRTGATPVQMTVVNGQTQPSGPRTDDRGQRSSVTGANGHLYGNGHGTDDVGTASGMTVSKDTDTKDGGDTGFPTPPPDKAFEDWKVSIAGPPGHPTHRSKLEKELGRIRVKLMQPGQLAFWKSRADFIQELLDGGKPPKAATPAAKPVKPKLANSARIPFEKRKEMFAKARKESGV